MNLYKVRITTSIWTEGKDYDIVSYHKYIESDYTIRRAILPALKSDGFFYLMNDNYVFDLDDTYPIKDEKFIDVAKRLRQVIRDDKLNSLSL
jgi:hypothetical protein